MKADKNPAAIFAFKAPWRRGWLGGIVKSAAKADAARRNGRKGGRPCKTQAPSNGRDRIQVEKPKHTTAARAQTL